MFWRRCTQGRIQGGGTIAPTKTYESNFFHHDFENLENSIRDIRPFWRPLFCHSSVVKYTSCPLQSEPAMRLDCQISLKSPPPLPAHTQSELLANCSRGSNGSDSNQVERSMYICINMLLQRALQ